MKSKELINILQIYIPDEYEIQTGEMEKDQVYATQEYTEKVGEITYKINTSIEVNRVEV